MLHNLFDNMPNTTAQSSFESMNHTLSTIKTFSSTSNGTSIPYACIAASQNYSGEAEQAPASNGICHKHHNCRGESVKLIMPKYARKTKR